MVGTATPKAPAELIVYFINSISQVITTMVGMTVTVGKPQLKTDPAPSYDVSAIIGFSGEITGSMVVSFQKDAAQKVASAFAGAEISAESPDFADAVGELANMIAGSAKKSFGSVASISVPSVIIGAGHVIARLQDVPCIVIPCRTPAGNFAVEVNIKSGARPAA